MAKANAKAAERSPKARPRAVASATARCRGAGRYRRGELERAGVVDREPVVAQGVGGHAHRAHEGERVPVGAEQDVLAVVEHRAAIFHAPRPPAGGAVGVEEGDGGALAHEPDGRGDARIAGADDGDATRRQAA